MKSLSRKKTKSGQDWKVIEEALEELLHEVLREWGFTPLEIRPQSSGSQFGKDCISRWTGEIDGQNILFEWSFESKGHGTPKRRRQIPPHEPKSKLTDIYNSKVPLDCWCIFSPHGYVDNAFRELVEAASKDKTYPFRIVLWTNYEQIEDLIACYPEIYKRVYKKESQLSVEERKSVLEAWKKDLVQKTFEGKSLRPTESERVSPSVPVQQIGIAIENLEAQSVQITTVYNDQQFGESVSSELSVQPFGAVGVIEKTKIKEEIDSAVRHLDSGEASKATELLARVLGKIEGKFSYGEELARTYNNLGVANNLERNYHQAIEYFRKAILTKNDFTIAITNLALAHVLNAAQLSDNERESELQKADEILTPLWDTFSVDSDTRIFRTKMQIIWEKDGLDSLLGFIKKEKDGTYGVLFTTDAQVAYLTAQAYLAAQQPEEALIYCESAYKVSQDAEILLLIGRAKLGIALQKDTVDSFVSDYDDLAPTFKDTTLLSQAMDDLDTAWELAEKGNQKYLFEPIRFFQKLVRIWMHKSTETDIESQNLSPSEEKVNQFLKSIESFRERNFEVAYNTLKQLPEFRNLSYEECYRYGRAFLYNGSPEIANEFFERIREESIQRKDFQYWIDISCLSILLGNKNNAIQSATQARELATDKESKRRALSHYGAVMLHYSDEEGGDRLMEGMIAFNNEFPELKVMEAFDVDKDRDKIVEIIENRREWVAEIKRNFTENPLPTYFLEKAFREPYVAVWRGRDTTLPFEYHTPNEDFHAKQVESFSKSSIFIPDYLFLLTISKLNLFVELVRVFPTLKVPFSLLRKIQHELLEKEDANLRRLWEFLRKTKSIELVKSIPEASLKVAAFKEISEDWLIDSINLAKSVDGVMLTDDLRLHKFLELEEVSSLNSWFLLQKGKDSGLLDPTMYSKAIGGLAELFYTFLSFNGDDLYRIVAADHYKLTTRSHHLIHQIFLPGSIWKSFSSVFVSFIKNMWNPGLILEDKLFWLGYLTGIYAELLVKASRQFSASEVGDKMQDIISDFAAMWLIAIKAATEEELLQLQSKLPELLNQPVFIPSRERLSKVIDDRLKQAKSK